MSLPAIPKVTSTKKPGIRPASLYNYFRYLHQHGNRVF
jgi:hypothetical protein